MGMWDILSEQFAPTMNLARQLNRSGNQELANGNYARVAGQNMIAPLAVSGQGIIDAAKPLGQAASALVGGTADFIGGALGLPQEYVRMRAANAGAKVGGAVAAKAAAPAKAAKPAAVKPATKAAPAPQAAAPDPLDPMVMARNTLEAGGTVPMSALGEYINNTAPRGGSASLKDQVMASILSSAEREYTRAAASGDDAAATRAAANLQAMRMSAAGISPSDLATFESLMGAR